MLPTLANGPHSDTDHEDGALPMYEGKWTESSETLNEYESDPSSRPPPVIPSNTQQQQLDDRVFPSLSTDPEFRMVLSFETDKRRRTTRLTSNGRIIYTFATLYENPSTKAGIFTQLRDKNSEIIATHIIAPARSLVKIGDAAPVPRKEWLAQCGFLSLNCGKFKFDKRWFKWRCLNDSGRVSVVLRDHSIKSTPTVARFTCIHRIDPTALITKSSPQQLLTHASSRSRSRSHSKRHSRSWRGSLELNPDYKDVWDYAVFSLIVLECFKGGRTLPPLEYEDETGSNVSYLANLIGLFSGTA